MWDDLLQLGMCLCCCVTLFNALITAIQGFCTRMPRSCVFVAALHRLMYSLLQYTGRALAQECQNMALQYGNLGWYVSLLLRRVSSFNALNYCHTGLLHKNAKYWSLDGGLARYVSFITALHHLMCSLLRYRALAQECQNIDLQYSVCVCHYALLFNAFITAPQGSCTRTPKLCSLVWTISLVRVHFAAVIV